MKYCPDCKQIKLRKEWGRNRARPGGLRTYCKVCERKRRVSYDKKSYQRHRPSRLIAHRAWNKSTNGRYSNLKKNAKYRGILFTISLDLCSKLTSIPCIYCNELQSKGYSGLDRLDSNKGYEPGNVVPCCEFCNWAKNTSTVDEFIERINKIHQRMNDGQFQIQLQSHTEADH